MNISWRMLLKQDYGMQRGKKNYFLSGADRLGNFIATSLVRNLWLFFPCSSIKVCYINLVSFLSSELQHFTFFYSLLQLDANLIEGEPYNHLAWKNKRQLKWRDKIQIYQKCGKPISKPAKTNSVTVDPSPVWSTQRFFAPARPPVGQKTSLVNFKHKINTSANYMDGIGTGCTSHNKEMCLHSKRLEYNFKINQ